MRSVSLAVAMVVGVAAFAAAGQEPASPSAGCVLIDEARDTFSAQDRRSALILVTRQLELAGRNMTPGDCAERYTLSHVRLGNTIMVLLAGPTGQREGRAAGMDDLPGLYNQIVRALVSGSSVGSMAVVDRTNVTTAQAEPRRVGIDSFGYARLGYGQMLGQRGGGNPAIGFGYRAELDSFALDVSFLNQQLPANAGYGASGGFAGSLLKLTALRFITPRANASAYFGGGMSWGATSGFSGSSSSAYSSWSGSGLQGELTAGYELPRASDLRFFLQADSTLPFYRTEGRNYTYSSGRTSTLTTGRSYNPSVTLSVGLGWRRHRR